MKWVFGPGLGVQEPSAGIQHNAGASPPDTLKKLALAAADEEPGIWQADTAQQTGVDQRFRVLRSDHLAVNTH